MIQNTEIENSIIMEGTHIDCGRRITNVLIGRNVTIPSQEQNIPKGRRLILGDASKCLSLTQFILEIDNPLRFG